MDIIDVLEKTRALLQKQGRISYRILKRQFALDDEALDDLKFELIEVQKVAADEEGKILVWTGGNTSEETASSAPELPSSAPSASSEREAPTAERRQLTVMFADMVGSTHLSSQLDPEELREVVRAYQQTSAEVIERYEGHIAQYLGDGLLVYFGYPTAHEDDAARAVHAGLEIVSALRELNTRMSEPIQVRIGIHTGPVVVGDMGGGERIEQLALGKTPNVAARVQGQAEPDEVMISTATYQLVEGLFECKDRGQPELKGVSTSLTLYHVVKESDAQGRFEVVARSGLNPLVGREVELQFLRQRWTQAQAGSGQAVLVSGEAGIGKSRLVQELKAQVTQAGVTRIEFRCSPYHQNSALYPIILHLERLMQFTPQDTPETKVAKLQQLLERYRFPQSDTLALLATLLSLPHPDGVPALTLSPQKQKELTQQTLVQWLIEEAEQTAVVCSWEDLHWADPSTLELLTLCLDQLPTARMLAVLVCRPEFTPPWGSRSYLSQLPLGRLERDDVEQIVERVTEGRRLPGEVVIQIAEKTDGVPLFVEELTKMVVESELVMAVNNHYELTGSLSSLSIPATLQDSLMARLDHLNTARGVAQLGAVLGREFSFEVIQAVSSLDTETLQLGFRQLVEAELLFQRGLPPHSRYIFKHALLQDTAYQSLLKKERQQYHQRAAQVLEERFTETVEIQPELLAHHYTQAGLVEQAIPYWQQAGQRAAQRSANVEAISHLTKGLDLLQTLPETPDRDQRELGLQIALGASLIATKGYTAPEVQPPYTRARELCGRLRDTPQLFPVLRGLQLFYLVKAEFRPALELGKQLLHIAEQEQDIALLVGAHVMLGQTLYWAGEISRAEQHIEEGLTLYDPEQHHYSDWAGGHPGVQCYAYAGLNDWVRGYPQRAVIRLKEARTLADSLSHPYSQAWVSLPTAQIYESRGETQLTLTQAEAAFTFATERGFRMIGFWAQCLRGWVLSASGQAKEGCKQIQDGARAWLATGAEQSSPYLLSLLATAYGRAAEPRKGLEVVAEAIALVDRNQERIYEAEVYRLQGELMLQQSQDAGEAEPSFQKALEIARHQQAKSWELRAATSWARLWKEQRKTEEARELLAPVYNWFTEGFDTRDLQEAKALLDTLA